MSRAQPSSKVHFINIGFKVISTTKNKSLYFAVTAALLPRFSSTLSVPIK